MDELPPDPMASAAASLKQSLTNKAEASLTRRIRGMVLGYLPPMLHPFVPGYSNKPVMEQYKELLVKRFWSFVFGAVLTLIILGLFAAAFLFVGVILLYVAIDIMFLS